MNSNSSTPLKIDVPSYMKIGAVFYHITPKKNAENFLTKGIDADIKGKVNALGPGFYTVKELDKVWQWMHFDDEIGPDTLPDKYSVIKIEIKTVPTEVWNGPNHDAEVIVAQTDVVWTKSAIEKELVKVNGQITGDEMRHNASFEAWCEDNFS